MKHVLLALLAVQAVFSKMDLRAKDYEKSPSTHVKLDENIEMYFIV